MAWSKTAPPPRAAGSETGPHLPPALN
uniref:Uncharacterized protein n=1 Tax=Arundo donax TaxID=35708 RepID=A0A0A9AXH2_ARUDO